VALFGQRGGNLWQAATMAPPPLDLSTLNRVNAIAVAYWGMILVWTFVVTVVWFTRGPDHPFVALFTAICTFALTPGVAVPLVRRLPVRWYGVPAGERLLHRVLGVGFFGRLLERSGWNRNNAYLPTSLTRGRLPLRVDAARGGMAAHGFCFAIHVLLSAAALFTGHAWGALGILLPGVFIHLYPVLLQRAVMLRLRPLLEKSLR
jgi:hypothetical protein